MSTVLAGDRCQPPVAATVPAFSGPCRGVALVDAASGWKAIRDEAISAVFERRNRPELEAEARLLLEKAPFDLRAEGRPETAVAAMGSAVPPLLRHDILGLSKAFAAVMKTPAVCIRLEAVTTNSCRKIHADYTDVRLITTYAGPGTQIVPPYTTPEPVNLREIETGWIGLFKGRLPGPGHTPCLHRSPPVGDTGQQRLVLVIDTPSFAADAPIQRSPR